MVGDDRLKAMAGLAAAGVTRSSSGRTDNRLRRLGVRVDRRLACANQERTNCDAGRKYGTTEGSWETGRTGNERSRRPGRAPVGLAEKDGAATRVASGARAVAGTWRENWGQG